MNKTAKVKAPAKINLTLDVLNRRKDGYHNIESIMQTVELADAVFLQTTSRDIRLETDTSRIPPGQENLAWQAARLMFDEFGLGGGIKIILEKRIPVQAGLAGGSTDAAAVIRGIAEIFDLELKSQRVLNIAARLGSDVSYFLFGGTTLVSGRGERIWELPDLPAQEICLLKFPFGLATPRIYRAWRGRKNLHRSRKALPAVFSGSWEEIKKEVGNDLEKSAIKKAPVIRKVLETLRKEGIEPAHLSGSGPTIVIYEHPPDWLQKMLAPFRVKLVPTRTREKDFTKE